MVTLRDGSPVYRDGDTLYHDRPGREAVTAEQAHGASARKVAPDELGLRPLRNGEPARTGISFDWNVAAAVAKSMPIWLAGGLNPGNVAEAINRVHPWAVDVSSGTETDGVKDLDKIRAFVRAAKSA